MREDQHHQAAHAPGHKYFHRNSITREPWPQKSVEYPTSRSSMTDTQFSSYSQVLKVDEGLGMVFGFAVVCTENGEPHFDLQSDHIPDDSMLKAAADFMQKSRATKEMHQGDEDGSVVFAFPLTAEIAKALDIETPRTGLIIGMKPGPEALAKFRDGTYSGFSLGGRYIVNQPVED